MDNYSKLANSILIEHTSILKENQLAEISPQSGQSFGDFLKGLQGKSRKDIFDAASYARLYIGNAYGMTSAANDDANPKVLMSKFLSTLANYINQNAFRNTSEYAEAMRAQNKKEDQMVRDFHNRPIKPGDIVNDGSEEFMRLQEMYNKIQGAKHAIEDQESGIRSLDGFFSDKKPAIEDAEQSIDSVAKTAAAVLSIPDQGKGRFIPGSAAGKVQKAKKELADKLVAAAKSINI